MARIMMSVIGLLSVTILAPACSSSVHDGNGPSANLCDPNYTPCVPIDSDVDCAGGSGDGPSYVSGPVTVIGVDIYGLDRDGNGVGCEGG